MSKKPYLIEIDSAGLRLALHIEHLDNISRADQLRFYKYIQNKFDSMNPPPPMDLSTKNEFACFCAIRSVMGHFARHVADFLIANNGAPESDRSEIRKGIYRGIWSNAISKKLDENDSWRTLDMKALIRSSPGLTVLTDAAIPPKLVIPSFLAEENAAPHTTADFEHYVFSFKPDEEGKVPPFEMATIWNTTIPEFELEWVAPESDGSDSNTC